MEPCLSNLAILFESITNLPIGANPSALMGTKITLKQVTPPPDVREKGPMLPSLIPILYEFDQGNHFTSSEKIQNASLTHPTQNVTLIYIFSPRKAQNMSLAQHAPLMYTYATVPPMTQTQGLCPLDVDHYIEIENDARVVNDEMAYDADYYERMVTIRGKTLFEVIKDKEMIEDGVNTGRITSLAAL
ncbi:hypothetical protein HAX54_049230 [Datura stramonium]|uniref:Uncharacterized protein n=1 Tax=Datura stramonium TaxID=4076 RepID=A0ABS8RQM0_DATST|nr:hypothetical protein [Datura stramonium]